MMANKANAPDQANKASGWGDTDMSIRTSKARTTFLSTIHCNGKSKWEEQGNLWEGVKFKPLQLVEGEEGGGVSSFLCLMSG